MIARISFPSRRLAFVLCLGAWMAGPASASRWMSRRPPARAEKADDPVAIQFKVGKNLDGKHPKILCAPRVVTGMGVAAELKTRFGEGPKAQDWTFKVVPLARLPAGVFSLVELNLGGQVAHRYVTLRQGMQKIQLTTLRGEVLEVGLEKLDRAMIAPVALGP